MKPILIVTMGIITAFMLTVNQPIKEVKHQECLKTNQGYYHNGCIDKNTDVPTTVFNKVL